ncbi:retrovirus-related pol polyprotein from transposon TNT 1-94 [Tanacetum coccineum]
MIKRRSKEAEMTKTIKVTGNALDAVIQIILSENIRNHRRKRTKEYSSEVLEVIALKKMTKRIKMRHVLGLKHLVSNLRDNIIGKGTISHGSLKIANVEHVDNLGFNLLSVDQIFDSKSKVIFFENDSEVVKEGKVIASKEQVRNLPKLKFDQHFCDACKIGKQAYASHKAKNLVLTTRCLELLYMDLLGPSVIRSYGGNLYTLVIVDDYSRKPTLVYFKVFRSKCFILNTKDYLTKFDLNSYEGVFLGYSQNSKAYIILNKHTIKIKESLNVTFDETPPPSKTSPLVDDDLDEEEAIKFTEKKDLENEIEDETLEIDDSQY